MDARSLRPQKNRSHRLILPYRRFRLVQPDPKSLGILRIVSVNRDWCWSQRVSNRDRGNSEMV